MIGKILGVILIIIGLFFCLAFFVSTSRDGVVEGEDLALLGIIGILPLGIGILTYVRAHKRQGSRLKSKREREILELASANGGQLTASKLAMSTDLSLDQAAKELNKLQEKGYVTLQNEENGALVYDFHELISNSK